MACGYWDNSFKCFSADGGTFWFLSRLNITHAIEISVRVPYILSLLNARGIEITVKLQLHVSWDFLYIHLVSSFHRKINAVCVWSLGCGHVLGLLTSRGADWWRRTRCIGVTWCYSISLAVEWKIAESSSNGPRGRWVLALKYSVSFQDRLLCDLLMSQIWSSHKCQAPLLFVALGRESRNLEASYWFRRKAFGLGVWMCRLRKKKKIWDMAKKGDLLGLP